ncbi:uroporphyrinogen decarboxylase family protein [Chloroflexota bacterium]
MMRHDEESQVTQEQEVIKRARDEIEKRTGKTPEQLYAEREKRVTDTIQLKVPDRMPVYLRGAFAARYAGISPSARFYDRAAYRDAYIKTILDFEPDVMFGDSGTGPSGLAMEKLDTKQYQWPGGPLRPDQPAQFLEMEIMKEDEYDLFITDPGDFILRYYLPRVWKALEPIGNLPRLLSLVGSTSMASQSARFSSPEIIQAFEVIFEAGQEQAKFNQLQEVGRAIGTPPLLTSRAGDAIAPFDFIADSLRGMRGIAVDMFKQPEKLHTAMERLLEYWQARAFPADPSGEGGTERVFGGMSHWCDESFLTKKQYETFFWPTCKKSLLATIELGFIPLPHPEGNMDDRIECFLEMPKGKILLWNEILDVVRAKEILGGHVCFMGGVPASLLWSGSPQEVEEYCKNIIKICGKGGGFILSCAGGEENAKPANVKAMVDAVKKYGRY